jgi:uncharacterized damage-inducible protein DinB
MRPARLLPSLLALAVLAAPLPLGAQGAAAPAGIRGELEAQLADAERKLVALAEAIPQDKYGWRPAEGVRSVSEVFVHVAGANFMITGIAGVPRDTSVRITAETERTLTDKAAVVDLLRRSFAHVRQAVAQVPEAELDAAVQLFGRPSTKRGVFLLLATHAHEHTGQAIAYARMNGVTPPWSAGG